MSYDHWKATNPADEELGPEPIIQCDGCGEECDPAWDYYEGRRFCSLCLEGELWGDPRDDRGDWKFHQEQDQ
jgi:hypothetical protein